MNAKKYKAQFDIIMGCFDLLKFDGIGDPDYLILSEHLPDFYKQLSADKKNHISSTEVMIMVMDKVENIIELAIKSTPEEDRITPTKIYDIADRELFEQGAKEIIEYIESLPRVYSFYFPLPNLKNKNLESIVLSENIEFLLIEDFKKYSLMTEAGTYLKITCKGFCQNRMQSSAGVSAFSIFKQLMIASYVDQKFTFNKYLPKPTKTFGVLYVEGDDVSNMKLMSVPDYFIDYLSQVVIHPTLLEEIKVYNQRVKDKENEPPGVIETLLGSYISNFEIYNPKSITIINTPEDDQNTSSIKNALEWAFDSLLNEDETMSYMQISIALEAILGSNLREGVTERLGDRCAYLIGTDQTERARIRKDFDEFYKIRSSLTHGRSKRLKHDDAKHFYWAKSALIRCIKKEMFYIKIKK